VAATASACPACGRTESTQTPPATGFDTVVGQRRFTHPPYSVRHCRGCGLFYKSHRLDDGELRDYYAALPFESFESGHLMPPDRLLVEAQRLLPEGSRILDYGCGVGRSLRHSVARHACYGVEPNERAAAVAASSGITMVAEDSLDERPGTFDMIVMSDVYEHLAQPVRAIRRLHRLLVPGGRLVIITGLADGARPPELIAEHWYFRVAGHMHMASHGHLAWLARECGMDLERETRLTHYDPRPIADLGQRIRAWAYERTHVEPQAAAARIIRAIPVLRRAALWNNAPMQTCLEDHVYATFRKRECAPG
jgi:SAM-dependent methyltransferase